MFGRKNPIDLGPADLEGFARSGLTSLREFLTLPVEVRGALIRENEAVVDGRARVLAVYIAGACSGAHLEVASTADPEAAEEGGNLAALNAALSGGTP